MYTGWSIKLTCNQMKLSSQKQKNIRTIKASHLIQDHCGSMKGAAHCLNPRITFFFPAPPRLTQTPTPSLSLDSTFLPPGYSSSQLCWLLTAGEAELGWGGLSSPSPHLTPQMSSQTPHCHTDKRLTSLLPSQWTWADPPSFQGWKDLISVPEDLRL